MPLGQIDPLNFIIAQRLAANQNVDSSTATRHALVGTMLGEGILGPIIARQLAIRDAASAAAAVVIAPPTGAAFPAVPTDGSRSIEGFEKWLRDEDDKDNQAIKSATERTEEAKKRQKERQDACKKLCNDQSQSGSKGSKTQQTATVAQTAPAPATAPQK
jgi:hypothetical protein